MAKLVIAAFRFKGGAKVFSKKLSPHRKAAQRWSSSTHIDRDIAKLVMGAFRFKWATKVFLKKLSPRKAAQRWSSSTHIDRDVAKMGKAAARFKAVVAYFEFSSISPGSTSEKIA